MAYAAYACRPCQLCKDAEAAEPVDQDSDENPEVVSIEALILERSRRRPSFGGSLVGSDTDGRSQTEAVDRPRPSQTKLERKSTDISDTGLKLDGDHIRAISMRRSLRQWGWIWRRPMYPMSDQGRRELLQWSQPASGYDAFLSHSWQTWGFWKYLALTLHSCRRWLLLWWSLWVSAAFLASYALDLPTYTQISPETPRFHCRCDTGPWVVVTGFVAMVTGLLLAPYAPDCCSQPDRCFMDAACIHQADPELKEQGIYSIAGLLGLSREMRVLWSPPYLSRLWCVFELAAFRKKNPAGRLVIAPLFVEHAVLIGILGAYAAAGALWSSSVVRAVVRDYLPTFYEMSFFVSLSPVLFMIHYLRRTAEAKHKLIHDLQNFRLEGALCSEKADRVFILRAIKRWYGSASAFEEHVQGPLRKELLQSATRISTTYTVLLASAATTAILEDHLALWRGGVPFWDGATHFVGFVLGSYTFWAAICFRAVISLSFATSKRRHFCFDYLISLSIHVLFCFMSVLGNMIAREVCSLDFWAAAAWMCTSAVLLVVIAMMRECCLS